MFKAPVRSKRRLLAEIGAQAETAAALLSDCALEDLGDWPGPRCVAAAGAEDLAWAQARLPECEHWLLQPAGNLGARIASVNARLRAAGCQRQIFIGIDCPTLDGAYLETAARALDRYDVALGPARDGGVVLMAVRGAWPPLEDLPWSTSALGAELRAACAQAGLSVAELEVRADVDCASDLVGLRARLAADLRPGRVALREWLSSAVASH
jgi:glycosyltransferase A (GT-A) superfamily protein (DUF2064 family)